MKILKISHSCLVVEEQGVRILFDPGVFSKEAANQNQIDFVIITHQHTDHLDMDVLKEIIRNNPSVKVVTNSSVGKLLVQQDIKYEVVDDGKTFDLNGLTLEAFGKKHAPIYPTIPEVENTGYLVAGKFYHPGDSYHQIDKPVEALALPLGAPWGKVSESMDFAIAIKPKKCFPIHDGILTDLGPYQSIAEKTLIPQGIGFMALTTNKSLDI